MSENHKFSRKNRQKIPKCKFCGLKLRDFSIEKDLFPGTSLFCKKRYKRQVFVNGINLWLESF